MRKKLTRTGNSVAIVLEKPLLEQVGWTDESEIEVSTNGDIVVLSPVRTAAREKKFRKSADKIASKYAGLFRRLSQ